jgi:hypothetical protein
MNLKNTISFKNKDDISPKDLNNNDVSDCLNKNKDNSNHFLRVYIGNSTSVVINKYYNTIKKLVFTYQLKKCLYNKIKRYIKEMRL